MPKLSLTLFGAPGVEVDGEPVEIKVRKAIALLLYLAVTGKPHTRDALATLLWPGYGQSDARANLRRTLSDLKRALPGEWLAVDRQIAGMSEDACIWVDVVELRSLAVGLGLSSGIHAFSEEQLTTLEAAVNLYGDDFLAGFTLPDAPEFDSWQAFECDALRQTVDQIRACLAEGYAANGKFDQAIHHARERLALDPLHEPAHRQLIQFYIQAGQPADAVRQYQQCVHVLETEIGVSPSEETTNLYQQLQHEPAEQASTGLSASFNGEPLPDIPPARQHNFPAQLTPLFGRDREQADICQLLTDSVTRLVTIVGAGGMGKTRLAQEAGMTLLDAFQDGVFFTPLAPLRRSQDIVTAIVEVLDLPLQPDSRSPRQQLIDYLSRKQMLLVLDNCEHLLDGIDLVHAILTAAPEVVVLATSQERLHLTGEKHFALGGINCGAGPEGAGSDSVRLFMYDAGFTLRDFRPSDEDYDQIARICRLVQGMPLGILLAATWMELLSPGEIAEQIERNLDFLESDHRDLPERQRSMRAVFDHSWTLLSGEERNVFARLSVFQGGFSLKAGLQVAKASLRQLMTMVNKSLLVRTSSGRFEIHELLRQYGAERLAGLVEERVATRDRHTGYYLDWLHGLTPDLHSQRQQAVIEEMDVERENMRLAWEWASTRGQRDLLAGAVTSMGEYFKWHGRYAEGGVIFRYTVDKLVGDDSVSGLRTRVLLLIWLAVCQRIRGDRTQSERLLDQAEASLSEAPLAAEDSRRERADILRERAELIYVSDSEAAADLGQKSLDLSEQIGDRVGMSKTLYLLGINARRIGHNEKAESLFNQSLSIHRSLGSPREIAFSLSMMGYSIIYQGRINEAELLIQESYDLFQKINDRSGRARALSDIAGLYGWQGRNAESVAAFVRSRDAYEVLGDKLPMMEVMVNLLGEELALGEYDRVRRESTAVLALARETGYRAVICGSTQLLGQVALAKREPHNARVILSEGMDIAKQFGLKHHLIIQAYLSLVARALGELENARKILVGAINDMLQGGDYHGLLQVLSIAALIKADMGALGRAVELDALAETLPLIANSQWWWDVARGELATLTEDIPAEEVAQAKESGRTLRPKDVATELLTELG